MRVERLDAPFGARIAGYDLSALGPGDGDALARALAAHGVLLLERQSLNDPEFVRVLAALGEPDRGIDPGIVDAFDPRVIYISALRDARGRTIGSQASGEVDWHADNFFRPEPSISVLYCLLPSPRGGITSFASGALAYRALPGALRDEIDGLHAVFPVPGVGRRASDGPVRRAPLVWKNPTTGEPTLYVSLLAERIEGLAPDEGRALIERLVAIQTSEAHVFRHAWRAGEVILYDNGQVLHRRSAFEGLRLMKAGRSFGSPEVFPSPAPPA